MPHPSTNSRNVVWLLQKTKWKEALYALLFLLLSGALLCLLSKALRPVRTDYGAVWRPYLAEPRDSLDYLYMGSSYAYCDVDPVRIYAGSGLTGYVLAGPEQTLSQAYWSLRQALQTQSPSLVVLETSALQFARFQNYTQVNVGYLPGGLNRLGAIFTAAEPELRTGLLFDLYFYHNRWKEVTPGEVSAALLPPQTDALKGYTAVDGVFAQISDGPFSRPEQVEEVYAENLIWLGRIAALCEKSGIPLALVLHPTYSQLPATVRSRMGADAAALGLPFYDWSEETLPLGLVPEDHYYDPGHLNRDGAALFSTWLGDFLVDEWALSPRTQGAEAAADWAKAVQAREIAAE